LNHQDTKGTKKDKNEGRFIGFSRILFSAVLGALGVLVVQWIFAAGSHFGVVSRPFCQ
jgi:hypothetical protein